MLREDIQINTVPVGELGIIPLVSCSEMGRQVDSYISSWRKHRESDYKDSLALAGYKKDSYLIKAANPRFGTGEAKGIIYESVRGKDIFILVDVCNHSITYSLCGKTNFMSPDDHFQDLKRIIAAIAGKAKRITVIMPFLYESRQHRRTARESLDCAMGLQELYAMGVENVITFDAHDPRVINCSPLKGFETIRASYQFLKGLCKNVGDVIFDADHLMMVSPDEGAIDRSVFFASVLGINMGMFYKRRDYSTIVDGMNPIVAHEYLGADINGKDVIVVDDMISSGGSMIDTASDLKERGARRVFIFSTFGLFTNGMEKFDKAYEKGIFDKILTTNLTYQSPELLTREYYISVDMFKYISYLIDTLNHDASIGDLLSPASKIKELISNYNARA
ncbi:MAG: ribose-phosphate pyrophosphokinase [Parasporobacterium sp.]|nr:ribose-phosphate pyrophosphokinase [Parasporobacterium sp.]